MKTNVIYSLIGILCILASCNKGENSATQAELRQKDQEFRENVMDNRQVIVLEDFVPTIEITEEIDGMTLDSIVKIQYEKYVKPKDNIGTRLALCGAGRVIIPVAVPKESKLAKAFALEDFWTFYSENGEYVNSVIYPPKPRHSRDNWDKYLE